jgi:eukaryotic-like serine/threonine-protein kinase
VGAIIHIVAESGKKGGLALASKAPRKAAVPQQADAQDISYEAISENALPRAAERRPSTTDDDPLLDAPTPLDNPPAITAETDILNNRAAIAARIANAPPAAGRGAGREPLHSQQATGITSTNNPAIHAVPTVGDRIGKYVVDRMVGSGGMGLVVAARHEALNELVAIKLLRPKAAGDKIHAERFAREARSMIKIKSEHVVRVLDAGTLDSGAPFIVMEYLVGRDLAQLLREEGPMTYTRAADLMLQVCEAVASAHAVGVIHRDLKPSNFFMTKRADGTPLVKVLDFGISKAVGQDGMVDPNLTETQAVFGSPTYMSPEQIRSAKHVDHRSDIWSLGVGLYEVTTGKLPFAADNVAGLLASIVADPPFFPRGFNPNLPVEFEELLLHLLQKNPKDRVQTVADFAFALSQFATPSNETNTLMERIARLAGRSLPTPRHAMTQTTGPKLPPLAAPVSSSGPHLPIDPGPNPSSAIGRISSPNLGGVMPPPGYSQQDLPSDARSSGHAFGSTGMDLSAQAPRRGNTLAGVAVGLCVAILILLGVGAYFVRSKLTATASAAAGQTSASATTTTESPPASAPTTTTAAAAANNGTPATGGSTSSDTTPPTAPKTGVGGKRINPTPKIPAPAHTPTGKPANPPTPPKTVDPTSERL